MSKSTPIVCIFLGAPGSGKGTQAKKLQAKLGIPHVSTGDMLRAEISKKSDLGKQVENILASGELVDDQLMLEVIRSRLSHADVQNGFILDGYPRNEKQARALHDLFMSLELEKPKVLYLSLSKASLVKRLVGRLSCSQCGAVFHRDLNPPKKENICDHCSHSPLVHRDDDNEDTVNQRLDIFEKQTKPLFDFYKAQGVLTQIDASRSVDAVQTDLLKALGQNL